MVQNIQLRCGARRARLIINAWAASMPRWNDTATNPQRPPLTIVSTSNRWRSVGDSRTKNVPNRLRNAVNVDLACSAAVLLESPQDIVSDLAGTGAWNSGLLRCTV